MTAVRTVWKFPIVPARQAVAMPAGAEIIHVGDDPDGTLCLWALVDDDGRPVVDRDIVAAGTGGWVPNDRLLTHLGSCVQGLLVWHIFEETDPDEVAR